MDTNAIREALAKATPGPWEVMHGSTDQPDIVIDSVSGQPIAEELFENDAHLIANSPTWLQQLLDENERLQKELQEQLEISHNFHRLANDYMHQLSDAKGEIERLKAELAKVADDKKLYQDLFIKQQLERGEKG